jgi:hypothetical protein
MTRRPGCGRSSVVATSRKNSAPVVKAFAGEAQDWARETTWQ